MAGIDQDFEFDDDSRGITFDFRGFIFKIIQNWIFIAISVAIALGIAYYINVRKQNIYRLNALVSVESEQNPFFTANTSISFNWGGVTGKIGKVMTTIATRSHNELVVDSLQFYKQYLKQGKYHLIDIYKKAPFEVIIDKSKPQALGRNLEIKHIDSNTFKLIYDFEESTSISAQRYSDKKILSVPVTSGNFEQTFTYGVPIELPFFNATINKVGTQIPKEDETFSIQFLEFDAVVLNYQNSVSVGYFKGSSTVLSLVQSGKNKAKIVDYLNTTIEILRKTELETKNLYATNTLKFIDSSLGQVNNVLKDVNKEMDDFRSSNKVLDVTAEIANISERLKEYQITKEAEQIKVNYLNNLESYLNRNSDYTKIAAPTSVGIQESGLLNSINTIIGLAIQRQNQKKTAREGSILLRRLDSQLDTEKNVALELIKSSRRGVNLQLGTVNGYIAKLENDLKKLPKEQQEFLKIQRQLNISQEAYNVYQTKRSEAAIVKAANVSDISMIDAAKDVGNTPIGSKKSLSYLIAIMLGALIPMSLIFIIFVLDNNIHSSEDLERLSRIPILGLVGKYNYKNNLVAFEKPKSSVAESFRAIRSSLKFVFGSSKDSEAAKVLLFTSSVSGEGKTFSSINTATVFALSGKKTVLVGLDLRKPKIYDDFDIENKVGAVNYLINDLDLDGVTHQTKIQNLDVILSGPIPPNPSELLIGDRMDAFMDELKEKYDIVVIDTPPLGLVTDALELSQYVDAILFMVRLNYTKKGMLSMINSKLKKGELKNVNFLINFYRHKKGYGYGYGNGYGYGYGSYGDAYHEKDKRSLKYKIQNLFKRN